MTCVEIGEKIGSSFHQLHSLKKKNEPHNIVYMSHVSKSLTCATQLGLSITGLLLTVYINMYIYILRTRCIQIDWRIILLGAASRFLRNVTSKAACVGMR